MNGVIVSPSELKLGFTGVGLSTSKTVTLKNNSSTAEVIQSALINGDPEISIESDNCQQKTLQPGDDCTVAVNMKSMTEGSKNAVLSFNTSNSATSDLAVNVSADTLPAVDLGTALDNTDISWFSGGDAPWRVETGSDYVNGSIAISGDVSDDQQSVLHTQVTGPGTLSFRWRASTEEFVDAITFLLDNRVSTYIEGGEDWTTASQTIPDGVHNLTWIYKKDAFISGNAVAGYLDQIQMLKSSNDNDTTDENNTTDEIWGGGSTGIVMLINLLLLAFLRAVMYLALSRKPLNNCLK
jgi:hypothetical protein